MCECVDTPHQENAKNPFPLSGSECEIINIKAKDFCCLENICSYVTNSMLIPLCGDKIFKVCYTVEITYKTSDCETKKVFGNGNLIFMNYPKCCPWHVKLHSITCFDNCNDEIQVRTCGKLLPC